MPKIAIISRDVTPDLADGRFAAVADALRVQGLEPAACRYDETREPEF